MHKILQEHPSSIREVDGLNAVEIQSQSRQAVHVDEWISANLRHQIENYGKSLKWLDAASECRNCR